MNGVESNFNCRSNKKLITNENVNKSTINRKTIDNFSNSMNIQKKKQIYKSNSFSKTFNKPDVKKIELYQNLKFEDSFEFIPDQGIPVTTLNNHLSNNEDCINQSTFENKENDEDDDINKMIKENPDRFKFSKEVCISIN